MTRATPLLLLAALLAACSSTPPAGERDAAEAADRAAAQALAATAPPDGAPLAPWLSAERARIEAARGAARQRFDEAEKTCWQRFAVNACLREARQQRRAVLDRLRQEDLALNEVERQRLTETRLRQLRQKQEDAARKGAAP
ncbi:MAG: hypothetical protein QM772_02925 [Ottowia sp.]|uniref:hypothetical protein n=1 Tax=Ottowia sp. TaxID=1898956 RepID=UPI0039E327BC